MCSATRQEFILLSDTLGVSMLVDAINHPHAARAPPRPPCSAPFTCRTHPSCRMGRRVGRPAGRAAVRRGQRSPPAGGAPLANAIVDIWHSDDEGYYDVQRPEVEEPTLRARFRTDAQGRSHSGPSCRSSTHPGRRAGGPMLKRDRAASESSGARAFHDFRAGLRDARSRTSSPSDSPYLDSDAVFGVKKR